MFTPPRPVCVLITGTCLLAASPARAETALQPGLWQETETGSENGRPAKSETSTRCMTAEEARQPSKAVVFNETLRQHCKALDYKRTEDNLTLRLQCGSQGFTVNIGATFTFHSPHHYSGLMKIAIQVATMKFTADKAIDAKRIGECKEKE